MTDPRTRNATPEETAAFERAKQRFFTAAEGRAPTDEERRRIEILTETTRQLAINIDLSVPEGRNKSIALTELESVLMRAVRGIFAPEETR